MKEIMAIIRPQCWKATKAALLEIGITGSTQHRVYGRGRQTGLRYLKPGTKEVLGVTYIPKRMVHLMVADEDVDRVIEVLIRVNRTPAFGDGKIYVCPVEEAIRISTRETGQLALAG